MDPIMITKHHPISSPFCFNFIRFPLSSSSTTTRRRFCNTSTFIKIRNISVSSNNQNPPNNNNNCLCQKFIKKFQFLFKTTTTIIDDDDDDDDDDDTNHLQNGGGGLLGMALLSSVTSSAKVRISPFVATLAANPTFVSGFFGWLTAQSLKVLLYFCFEKKLDLRIMYSSGGMPSSHSALCTALTTSVAICHGVADSLFPVSLGFTLIVMYDAIGVRRHAGMQAQVLNLIVQDLFQGHPISKRKLKELLGHTPSQVFAGALLGILVACFCCRFGAT